VPFFRMHLYTFMRRWLPIDPILDGHCSAGDVINYILHVDQATTDPPRRGKRGIR
jgi:hypothetical protein